MENRKCRIWLNLAGIDGEDLKKRRKKGKSE